MNRLTNEQALEILKGDFSKVPLNKNDTHSGLFTQAFNMAIEALKTLQHYKALEEQGCLIELKQGRWIDNHCSICGMTPLGEELWEHLDLDPPKFENYMNYCPECGAKMLKGTE